MNKPQGLDTKLHKIVPSRTNLLKSQNKNGVYSGCRKSSGTSGGSFGWDDASSA